MSSVNTPVIPDFTQDPRLLEIFGESGPYYTSYPTHGNWTNDVDHAGYVASLKNFFLKNPDEPVHIYVHIPFCAKLCFYCICNIVVTNNRERMQYFVDYLCREIDLLGKFFAENSIRPNVKEIHLGGGTPSHLENDQLSHIVDKLGEIADLKGLYEFAMEIDPRTTSQESLKFYSTLGINRISFGVQDFDPTVQEAINRVQPVEMVEALLSPDVRACFEGLNFDLLYGLPHQTRQTFRRTVEQVNKLAPERITLLKYAHAPDLRKHMRLIDSAMLPSTDELPLMFYDAVQSLTANGYTWIGIDHFAKPTDDLAQAVEQRQAWRNFGGFTTGKTHHLIGIGPTATCAVGDAYYQNAYEMKGYYQAIDEERFPVQLGYQMDADEVLRREVIFRLLCDSSLDFRPIENKFGITFSDYFARELDSLARFEREGIIELKQDSIGFTPTGQFFGRHVAKVFDKFLQKADGVYRITGP